MGLESKLFPISPVSFPVGSSIFFFMLTFPTSPFGKRIQIDFHTVKFLARIPVRPIGRSSAVRLRLPTTSRRSPVGYALMVTFPLHLQKGQYCHHRHNKAATYRRSLPLDTLPFLLRGKGRCPNKGLIGEQNQVASI